MALEKSHEYQAPTSPADRVLYTTHEPGWLSGVSGRERPVTPGADTGILALVVLILVLVGFNMRHVRRLLKSVPVDLLQIRRRANAFDDHTANENRTLLVLLFQTVIFGGILLFLWLGAPMLTGDGMAGARDKVLPAVLALTGVAGGLYLFQLLSNCLVGYVFTDRMSAVQWRRGLNASLVLLGIALALPTLVSLFYPSLTAAMLWVAAAAYIICRLLYISKGFRIFYTNFPSLFYFILYLCTLEIIPLMAAYLSAMEICNQL